MNAIVQEHPMGCAVACVASLLGITYTHALKLFSNPSYASTRGYYCREITDALRKKGLHYSWKKVSTKNKNPINKEKIIIFIARSQKYPSGHFLLKTKKGWMDSWNNFPHITPARAGFQKKLPGNPQWAIFPSPAFQKR